MTWSDYEISGRGDRLYYVGPAADLEHMESLMDVHFEPVVISGIRAHWVDKRFLMVTLILAPLCAVIAYFPIALVLKDSVDAPTAWRALSISHGFAIAIAPYTAALIVDTLIPFFLRISPARIELVRGKLFTESLAHVWTLNVSDATIVVDPKQNAVFISAGDEHNSDRMIELPIAGVKDKASLAYNLFWAAISTQAAPQLPKDSFLDK